MLLVGWVVVTVMRWWCRLTRLSPDLGELTALVVLDASHNYIRSLPREIEDLQRLTTLRLGEEQAEEEGREGGRGGQLLLQQEREREGV